MTKCNIWYSSGKQFCRGYCVSIMLVVSFMDAGENVSNLRFPYLSIHLKASQAAGKGILDSTRNWSHHQNPGIKIKVPSVAGFEVLKTSKVFPVFWQLTITYPCTPHQYTVEITHVFVYYLYMSLFLFGCSLRREEPSPEDSVEVEMLESHIPRQEDTNLGVVEHRETAAAVVNLSRPAEISQRNQYPKRKRGKYFQYSGEDHVTIGKFTSESAKSRN